jgi:cell volume regulation protein A
VTDACAKPLLCGGDPSTVGACELSRAIGFGGAGLLQDSGFLAVYVAGLTVGGLQLDARPALLAFHEGLASIAEIGLFLALGLLVFPSQLGNVAGKAFCSP